MNDDKQHRQTKQSEPEQEVVEKRIVCAKEPLINAGSVEHILKACSPDVRGSVKPAQIMKSENDAIAGI
jgi:hypothetical protein